MGLRRKEGIDTYPMSHRNLFRDQQNLVVWWPAASISTGRDITVRTSLTGGKTEERAILFFSSLFLYLFLFFASLYVCALLYLSEESLADCISVLDIVGSAKWSHLQLPSSDWWIRFGEFFAKAGIHMLQLLLFCLWYTNNYFPLWNKLNNKN